MLIIQKEVPNVTVYCYGSKKFKELEGTIPTTLTGQFDALKWCEYSFNGKKNYLSFGAAAVDSDFYLRLLEGLSSEEPTWTDFSVKIDNLYRQVNGVDIQHCFTMRNFSQIKINHKSNAEGNPEEIIFTFT